MKKSNFNNKDRSNKKKECIYKIKFNKYFKITNNALNLNALLSLLTKISSFINKEDPE
jgi:hypothetical protein